jgi:tetratricopeptide (TPR) repeat protein
MGADEVGTARTLREHRVVTDALVAKHGGRIVKTTGDGVLLEFPSVVDAVECAVAVQAVMAERNEGVPAERLMLFRIGINLGDILIEGDDILGDGVNIAARIENECEPGGVCLSDDAYRQVRGKTLLAFDDLGERSLKNIDQPVRLYAVRSASFSTEPTLAVGEKPLPLPWAAMASAYMVGDSETEIEMADRAVALNPNSFDAWLNRGWVCRVAGLLEEALHSFERANRMSPIDPQLYRSFAGMGYAFIELGRFDEAIVTGKKAQRKNSSFLPTYRCLASAFAHLGRDAEAREAAAHLLELDHAFTISGWMSRGGQSNAKLLIEGLRKAGLPE